MPCRHLICLLLSGTAPSAVASLELFEPYNDPFHWANETKFESTCQPQTTATSADQPQQATSNEGGSDDDAMDTESNGVGMGSSGESHDSVDGGNSDTNTPAEEQTSGSTVRSAKKTSSSGRYNALMRVCKDICSDGCYNESIFLRVEAVLDTLWKFAGKLTRADVTQLLEVIHSQDPSIPIAATARGPVPASVPSDDLHPDVVAMANTPTPPQRRCKRTRSASKHADGHGRKMKKRSDTNTTACQFCERSVVISKVTARRCRDWAQHSAKCMKEFHN